MATKITDLVSNSHDGEAMLCGDFRRGIPRGPLWSVLLGWPRKWAWLLNVPQPEGFGVLSAPTGHIQSTSAGHSLGHNGVSGIRSAGLRE